MKNLFTKRNISLLVSMLVILFFYLLPDMTWGLSHEALWAIGIFFASLIMWINVSIDWPSLISLFMIGLLPSYGFNKMLQGSFGNSTVAFLLFTFILVYPLSQTNFVRRITIAFITNKVARKGPWHFVCFLFGAITFIGLFISPSVLFVAFLPFLEDIYKVLDIKKGSKTGNMLMMGTAFCISLSSGMTPIGHVWPTLAMSYFAGSEIGYPISAFEYMAFGIPTGVVLFVLLVLIFKFIYRPDDIKDIDTAKAISLRGSIAKADAREKAIIGVLVLVVFLWISPSLVKNAMPEYYALINGMTTAMPPLLGCILMFVISFDGKPLLNFKEATTKGVMWGSILMTAAATLVGATLTNKDLGISTWLSDMMGPVASGLSVSVLVFFFVAWAVIETNFSSNIVTTTVVSSIMLTVLSSLPKGTICIPAAICLIGFSAGICNMTPAGQSTINTVAIGSGWTDSKSMFVWGGVFAVVSIIVISLLGYNLGAIFMAI